MAVGDDEEMVKVKVGDRVLFPKYTGTELKIDDVDYASWLSSRPRLHQVHLPLVRPQAAGDFAAIEGPDWRATQRPRGRSWATG